MSAGACQPRLVRPRHLRPGIASGLVAGAPQLGAGAAVGTVVGAGAARRRSAAPPPIGGARARGRRGPRRDPRRHDDGSRRIDRRPARPRDRRVEPRRHGRRAAQGRWRRSGSAARWGSAPPPSAAATRPGRVDDRRSRHRQRAARLVSVGAATAGDAAPAWAQQLRAEQTRPSSPPARRPRGSRGSTAAAPAPLPTSRKGTEPCDSSAPSSAMGERPSPRHPISAPASSGTSGSAPPASRPATGG